MNDAFVGTWSLRPHVGKVLQYDADWMASKQGRPLSLSLPFTPGNQPQRGDAVRAYFENLLPDSQNIRERIARRFHAGSMHAFRLLAEVGRDCAGALQILPDNAPPKGLQEVKATPLSDAAGHRWPCEELQYFSAPRRSLRAHAAVRRTICLPGHRHQRKSVVAIQGKDGHGSALEEHALGHA